MKTIIIFFILQSINVVLSTMKSLVMIRSNNRHLSAMVNAVQYGFYAIVIKQIANLGLEITVIITIITNFLGVYISYYIMSFIQKERVWMIKTQPLKEKETNHIIEKLNECNIAFNVMEIRGKQMFEIYSYSSRESEDIRKVLDSTGLDIKIFITEMIHQL